MEAIKFYKRIVYKDIPIYINPEKPDWFVPTQSTDELLRMLKGQKTIDEIVSEYSKIFAKDNCHILQEIRHFLQRIQIGVSSEFKGRSHYKRITSLKECWFHITNQCNMACTHCMFASNPTTHRHLEFDDLLTSIYQASSLGCKVFYFTGGEPCVYKGFTAICDEILRQKDVHIIILTNGRNIFQFDEWLKSAPTERTHFQLSIDGLEKNHDTIRGKGSFQQLIDSVTYLKNLRFPITLAMSVNRKNVFEMAPIIDIAEEIGVKNIHFLWLFKKGKATDDLFVEPGTIFPELVRSYERAQNKRRTFCEILRILKPGGRICISDIVSVEDIPIHIKYNEKLRGECIGGAMTESELFSLLEDLSFENILLHKRFLYRNVQGYNFYSITYSAYSAYKLQDLVKRDIIYRGPFAAIVTDDGQTIRRGRKARLMLPQHYELNESFFLLNEEGNVSNVNQEKSCSCFELPQTAQNKEYSVSETKQYKSGCLICGADIRYLDKNQKMVCQYCQKEYSTNSLCLNRHYVCDKCHVQDSLELIRNMSLETRQSDMIGLL